MSSLTIATAAAATADVLQEVVAVCAVATAALESCQWVLPPSALLEPVRLHLLCSDVVGVTVSKAGELGVTTAAAAVGAAVTAHKT